MMAIPQKKEKFASVSEEDFPSTVTVPVEFHSDGTNAFWIIAAYVVLSPFAAFPAVARLPSTLSLPSTACSASGLTASSFLPTSGRVRPCADISTVLTIGATAWEASAAFGIVTAIGLMLPAPSAYQTWALGSRLPHGFTPLKSFCARPLKKLRWL